MANYRNIHGINIETVTSNPDNPANGQVWYNSTDQKLRGNAQTTADAWASGGNMNTARNSLGGAGTQTAALAFGGQPPNRALTESYDGSSWTEVADLGTARNGLGSTGTQTSAIAYAGEGSAPTPKNLTETWNASSWTEVGDLNSTRKYSGTSGADSTAS